MPRRASLLSSDGQDLAEVAEDRLVARVAQVGGHEMGQLVFLDVAPLHRPPGRCDSP